jgi:carbamoylphosphate synthase large subunit
LSINHYGESELSGHVLKNKVKFRELIKELFRLLFQVSIEEIQRLSDDEIRFPFVIKPAVGFFSIGVHIVENEKTG